MKNEHSSIHILGGKHFILLKALKDTDPSVFVHSIPQNFEGHVPLFFNVKGSFLSYEIIDDQNNDVIKFILPPIKKNCSISIEIEYFVLSADSQEKLSKQNPEDFPSDLTNSSKSIQSNNLIMRLVSKILKGFCRDDFVFSKKVVRFAYLHAIHFNFLKKILYSKSSLNKIFFKDSYFMNLEDALSSLLFGSLCAGEANLIAALLRSNKIPSRVLIVTPTTFGKDFWIDSQHYIVESYYKNAGWLRSQSWVFPLANKHSIVLRRVPYKDEQAAGNGLSKYGGTSTWFWFENENIVFGKPGEYMQYSLPDSKKVGVPALIGWKDGTISLEKPSAEKLIKTSQEIWGLYKKKLGSYTEAKESLLGEIVLLQKKLIDLLKQKKYEEFYEIIEEIKRTISS